MDFPDIHYSNEFNRQYSTSALLHLLKICLRKETWLQQTNHEFLHKGSDGEIRSFTKAKGSTSNAVILIISARHLTSASTIFSSDRLMGRKLHLSLLVALLLSFHHLNYDEVSSIAHVPAQICLIARGEAKERH